MNLACILELAETGTIYCLLIEKQVSLPSSRKSSPIKHYFSSSLIFQMKLWQLPQAPPIILIAIWTVQGKPLLVRKDFSFNMSMSRTNVSA